MSAISPSWTVVKSGIPYTTEDNDCKIIYRANHPSEAVMKLDNSDQSLSNIFSTEDEVQVKIGSTLMMTAFVNKIVDVWNPGRKIDLILHLVNWGDYMAGKRPFEKEYKKETSVHEVFLDAANSVPGLGSGIYTFPLSSQKIKRDFAGTYVKDVWDAAAEAGGGDFYCDENKVFNASPANFIDLLEPSTGLKYKIQGTTPAAANQLQPLFTKEIKFIRDVSTFFRKVTVTNGIPETNPTDTDLFTTYKTLHPTYNKEFSGYIGFFGNLTDYAVAGRFPHSFQPLTDVGGGFQIPTVRCLVPISNAQSITITGITFDSAGNLILQRFNILPTDWKQLRFIIRNQLTGAAVTSVVLRLTDVAANGRYEREIYNDIKDQSGSRTNFVYLEYDLPDPANPGGTGWTKIGNPTKIEQVSLFFTPTTGYTANSYVELGKIYFFRRQRQSSSSLGGTPVTEKIIINNTLKNKTSLKNFADNEFTRVSTNPIKQPDFTIEGNVNFKRPSYLIDVDFTSFFGTGRTSAPQSARLEEIHHNLIKGIHFTDIFIDNSFNRK